jgi:hypothetical protein
MSRSQNFIEAMPTITAVRDSRFGLRKLVKNPENPTIASYSAPGIGPNGEHQN